MEHIQCNLCETDNTVVRFANTMSVKDVNGHPADPEHFYCTTLSYGQHYRIVQCKQCGLVYTDPRRRPADMINDYEAVVDTRYLEEREGRILTFNRNIRPLEKMIPARNGHRLLDVGAHVGVGCQGCHLEGYVAIPADCGSCHMLDPDTCSLDRACSDCHLSDTSWSDVAP